MTKIFQFPNHDVYDLYIYLVYLICNISNKLQLELQSLRSVRAESPAEETRKYAYRRRGRGEKRNGPSVCIPFDICWGRLSTYWSSRSAVTSVQ
uniref:Uncharacterized protein n=1 Tax=Arion vulgaris TaxID=1028688 RepID=A0A0B7BJA5_9EUPU